MLTVFVLSDDEDCSILKDILCNRGYNIIGVQGCDEAKKLALEQSPFVIICETCTPDGKDWKQVLEMTREANGRPLLVVCSKNADARLWAEALNFGAHDVLVKPFEPKEVVSVVRFAARQKFVQS